MHHAVHSANTYQSQNFVTGPAQVADLLFQIQHALAIVDQPRADRSQLELSCFPLKQPCTDLFFKRSDPVGYGSLGQVQMLGRGSEAFQPCNLQKRLDETRIH
ncbi:hypothetical protein D9M71_824130 [compost metagenome]